MLILLIRDALYPLKTYRLFLELFLETEVTTFWLDFKKHFLKQKLDNHIYKSWLEPIIPSKIEKKGQTLHLTLQTPSNIHKKWLQENFLKDFYKHIDTFYHGSLHIDLEVAPYLPTQKREYPQIPQPVRSDSFFNPSYCFENFIVGENNNLAYGASIAIAKQSKREEGFNPLFIYGPSGLGKTHLLNAIGQKYLQQFPESKVIYLSAERFLNEYIGALQNKKMDLFRKKYRTNCDLLLMDDIQIIAKGKSIQEEFFHTFNELYNKKIKVVVCCDQAPGSIAHLENRIKTRLEGGLMADIHYPNKEIRLAILKSKAQQKNISLSPENLEKIVQTCKKSIREMEGILNKIKIMSDLYERFLTSEDIEKLLANIKTNLDIEEIQKIISKNFCVPIEELKSPSRKKNIVTARHTAMFLVRKYLKKSLNDISLAFGKKDHTTVLNSIKKVEKLQNTDKDFKRLMEALHKEIHNNY